MDDFGYEKRLFGNVWIGNEFHGTYRVKGSIFGKESQKR
jgi:hypothetical protein